MVRTGTVIFKNVKGGDLQSSPQKGGDPSGSIEETSGRAEEKKEEVSSDKRANGALERVSLKQKRESVQAMEAVLGDNESPIKSLIVTQNQIPDYAGLRTYLDERNLGSADEQEFRVVDLPLHKA